MLFRSLINLEIGYLMPPMGLNLFIAGFRFGRPVPDLYRVVLPFIGVFVVALMITTYVPWLSLAFLPDQLELMRAADHPEATPDPTPQPDGTGAPVPAPDTGDCDLPRDGESFEDFEARCEGGGGGAAAPDTADCDLPRDGETFEAFEARCLGGDPSGEAAPPAPPAVPADCDLPRTDETFEQFQARCPM